MYSPPHQKYNNDFLILRSDGTEVMHLAIADNPQNQLRSPDHDQRLLLSAESEIAPDHHSFLISTKLIKSQTINE